MLRDALIDGGDLELRFQSGEAIPVHSQKMKLASSVLKDTITAVLDDLIASSAAKRRRTAEGSSSVTEQGELPSLKVSHPSPKVPGVHLFCIAVPWDRLQHGPPPMPMRLTQVDGAYEDWLEVLRLIYYGGGLHVCGGRMHGASPRTLRSIT